MNQGWIRRSLGDCCEMYQPKTISSKPLVEDGGYPVYRANGVIGRYDQFNHEDSQLMITCRGATCGSLNVSEPRSWITGNAMVIRPRGVSIDLKFLEFSLRGPIDLSRAITGAAQPQITRTNLAPLEFSYPTCVLEQQRIVAILDEAFEGIATAKANAEKNLQNALEILGSYLAPAFTNGGRGWIKKSLEDTVDGACSLSYGIVQPGDEWSDGLPVVRPTDLTTKLIEIEGLKRINPNLADSYRRTTLRGGDILLCVRGSTGTVSVAFTALAGANVTRGIVPIFLDQSMVLQDFGYYLMRCEPVQSQIREKNFGAALMQINIRDLRLIKLLVPPLREQKELAAKFNELALETQRLESLYQQKLTALAKLKKSLVHEAFSGRL